VVRSIIRCQQLDKLTLAKRRNLQEGIPHRQRDMAPSKIQERTELQNATRRERIR
jgi:ribosome modulation factor